MVVPPTHPPTPNNQGLYPRSGVQYGCTYVLYHQRPAICHSDYCVVVLDAAPSTHNNSNRSTSSPMQQWYELQIANRLASQVSKRLLLLYVDVKDDVDTNTLGCLAHVAVQEVGVRRWTVSRGLPPAAPSTVKGGEKTVKGGEKQGNTQSKGKQQGGIEQGQQQQEEKEQQDIGVGK